MTKDDRAELVALAGTFAPSLTQDLEEPEGLVDEQVLTLVAQAFASQEARVVDKTAEVFELKVDKEHLKTEVEELQEQICCLEAQLQDACAQAPEAAPAPAVPDEQVQALLRYHRVLYQDVHIEVYMDDNRVQRSRYRVVPRPAQAEDVAGMRDTEEALRVVLKDGKRYCLPWLDKEAC